jgi:uncharacterized delta-60 repeat protein
MAPNGDVLAAGTTGTSEGWVVARFDQGGVANTTFGSNSAAVLPNGAGDTLNAIAYDVADNKVLLCGVSNDQFTVVRLNDDGTADQQFNANGIVRLSAVTYPQGSVCRALVAQPDSRIVAAGFDASPDPLGLVVRFETNGMPDDGFGSSGRHVDAVDTRFHGLVLDPGGMVAGGDNVVDIPDFYLRRLDDGGQPTAAFGNGGAVSFSDDVPATQELVRDDGGRLTMCGYDLAGVGAGVLGALSPDGMPLWSGGGTRSYTPYGNNDRFWGCAAAPGGFVISVGFGFGAEAHQTYVLRHDPNGDLDPGFGDAGAWRFEVGPAQARSLYDVTLQADGRIVAAGYQQGSGFALVRLWH